MIRADQPADQPVDQLAESWPVWGMVATVVVTEPAALAAATATLRGELAAVDAACSRFRADSELSVVNASPGRWVAVSPLFVTLLGAALAAAGRTGGAVDPALGTALRGLGHDREVMLVGAGPARSVTVSYHGPRWREVELDAGRHRVRVPPGVELDLGATAKACAADRAATAASAAVGGRPVLVNLGGDLAIRGCGEDRPFTIALAEDHRAADGPRILAGDGGIATSTTGVRTWRWAGRRHHHLLDPVTGLPASGPWRTVTAAAATCLAANTATTATIAKAAHGLSWLSGTGLPARLVGADGEVRRVNGWPRDTEVRCSPR